MLKINTLKKISVVASILGVTLMLSGSTYAYGPERRDFTAQNPADYVTFNSITNNPTVGDERNFVRIRKVGDPKFVDSIDIIPGQEYEVYMYYHNNAKTSLNTRANNFKGVALDAKLKASFPARVAKGATARVYAEISAKNANPAKVWDESIIRSPQRDVALRYVHGSARITSKGPINGRTLSGENLLGEGTNLGYDALNGILPGCDEYSGYITYRFKADHAEFETSKEVSKAGANSWVENQKISAGEEVDFKITYRNTGTIFQENVNIKDVLPNGMVMVPGSARISVPSNPTPTPISDNLVASGVNIGRYSPGGTATLTFRAKIDSSKLVCGTNQLVNTSHAITQNGSKKDTATVTVNKNCTPMEKDFCQITGKTHLRKNDPKCFEPCKITGKENLKKDDPKCKQDDRCTVKGRESLPKNDPKCFEPCQIKGKENLKKDDPKCFEPCIVKGKENLKKDDPKCSDPCPVKGKENLKANDPNCFEPCVIKGKEGLKSTDPNCVENCKISGRESLKSTDIDCSEPCRIAGKEKLNAKDPACAETQIPNELPKTGPMEAAMMIIAIMAISGALAYWIRSREEMKKVVLGAKKDSDNSKEDLN